MKTSLTAILAALCFIADGVLKASDPMDHQKTPPKSDAAYKDAMKHVSELKLGLSAHKVLALLGNPQSKVGNHWTYNFWDIAPPPQVGNQMVMGLTITFEAEVIAKIDYATLCATGPGVPAPTKKPGKKAK